MPIPKKSVPVSFSDLRPISILPALSKILEGIVSEQIKLYLRSNNILSPFQSGFSGGYSCETVLLNVSDDIVQAADRGELTVF